TKFTAPLCIKTVEFGSEGQANAPIETYFSQILASITLGNCLKPLALSSAVASTRASGWFSRIHATARGSNGSRAELATVTCRQRREGRIRRRSASQSRFDQRITTSSCFGSATYRVAR